MLVRPSHDNDTVPVPRWSERQPAGHDRGSASASVRHRTEEMWRCRFQNDFASCSSLSAANHPRTIDLRPRRLRLFRLPAMSRLVRLDRQRPKTTPEAMVTPRARRRAGSPISPSREAKNFSVLAATARVTGLENWHAVRSHSRALSASDSARPPESMFNRQLPGGPSKRGPRRRPPPPRTCPFGI